MDAGTDGAYIAIEVSHPDESQRNLYFRHFTTFRKPLEDLLGERFIWESAGLNENQTPVARIYQRLEKVNVHREADWPAIISFLKTRIIALDSFWTEYKDIFEMLS